MYQKFENPEEYELNDSSINSSCKENFKSSTILSSFAHFLKIKLTLEWTNLSYSHTSHNHTTEILKNLSGFANPGQILAIMGSSGSGKTSLLSILSKQIIPQRNIKIAGKVSINSIDINTIEYQVFTRYVMQQDILMPTFTVKEALTFAAKLKIRGSSKVIKQKVDEILEDLKLTSVADTLIGNEIIKGLSGGEKKRVCIGIELLSEPHILILDEPTSGLDSFTAEMVMGLLKQQADKGKTIVLTIHQPSSNIFNIFDRLILMVEGNFVYQGPAKMSAEYFKYNGYPCLERTNPPDHFMRVLYIKHRDNYTESEAKMLKVFVEAYKNNEITVFQDKNDLKSEGSELMTKKFKAGLLARMSVLLVRAYKNSLRNPMILGFNIMQNIVISLILDLCYGRLGYDQKGVLNREGVIFFCATHFVLSAAQVSAMTFPIERPIVLKEYKEGLYGIVEYFVAKFISELPSQIVGVFIFISILYFSVDLNQESPDKYIILVCICILMNLCGSAYGKLGGAVSKDVQAATIWGPTIAAPLMMFGGYYGKSTSNSDSFSWIKYMSAYYYGFRAGCLNEFRGLDLDNDVYESPLDSLGISGSIWENILYSFLVMLVCSILSIIILKILAEKHKF